MEVPIKNIVETIDLTPRDALLPLIECVINSIISLMETDIDKSKKEIEIQIFRGDMPKQLSLSSTPTIHSLTIIDNGIGFNEKNYTSFRTPFSNVYKEDYGCKGLGRFTILAAFKKIRVCSNFEEDGVWRYREFECDEEREVTPVKLENSKKRISKTSVDLIESFNPVIKDKTAISIPEISLEIMQHCLIYYLNGDLPIIKIIEGKDGKSEIINDLFTKVSKENERVFSVQDYHFKVYITKALKIGNRKNHYAHFCANSRTVGEPRSIGRFNSLFNYPLIQNGQQYYLDVYVVSEYLNKNVYKSRNGFTIPEEKENILFEDDEKLSFQEIEEGLTRVLEEEYEPHVKETKKQSMEEIKAYIVNEAPRYTSLLKNPDVLNAIPANLPDDKKEEHLYRITFNARKTVEKHLQDFIDNKQINEETILKLKQDIKDKTAYDSDSLADYMMRRKAIIDLFDKFLEADSSGKYKLEADIHNIIFPMGVTSDEISYEMHNLWLLDERFLTYKFIAADKSITSMSQKKSRKETDLIMLDENPKMFDNPISFGDKSNGDLNSMVIFEFKRPGEVAHQKNKEDYRWEFSVLVELYFDDFLYSPDKKNYKGKQVILKRETPKFGFIVIDVIPPLLEQYNIDKGWKKTPFGTFYKMESGKNMHLEVMTFAKLIEYAKSRHMPFFDKLFGKFN